MAVFFMRNWLAGIAILAFSLTGCSRPAPTAEETPLSGDSVPVAGDWVVQEIPADPDTLNPITGQDATGT